MAIQAGDIEYVRYRNGYLRAHCKSTDSVLVTWGSGFAQPMTAQTWDERLFVENPENVRVLEGPEAEQAEAFFARTRRG